MNWTTRLKRHGGHTPLIQRRARQIAFLRVFTPFSTRRQVAEDCLKWLNEHPLRTLNAAEERFFGIGKVQV